MVGAVLATIVILLGLLTLGLSGFLCVVMALPIIVPFIFLGSVITHLIKRYKDIKTPNHFSVLLLPLIPFLIAAPAEKWLKADEIQVVEVRTERVYPYTPAQVYDAIKSVDTLVADKPLLMRFDLPVPTKCVLEKEAVGGIRTCYFRGGNMSRGDFGGGVIRERITALDPGKLLKMDVTDYNLIGRKWLGFKEAIYYFEKVGEHSCKLVRITTYTSKLSPRIYWEPMEKIGISEEHDYVFNNLANDLSRKYGKY